MDTEFEQYHLGVVMDENELASFEEHLLCCPACVIRAEAAANYVDVMRIALLRVGHASAYRFIMDLRGDWKR